jgi:hypothetical protein
MNRFVLPVLLAVSVLLAPGCSSTLDKLDVMNQSLFAYAKAMRWSRFDLVYAFHQHPGEAPLPMPGHLQKIQVTGYEVLSSQPGADTESLTQTVRIRYVHQDTAREITIDVPLSWLYDQDVERWYITSPPPALE